MIKSKTHKGRPLRMVVVGQFQVGKSTLINCFLRQRIAPCGDSTMPTTAEVHGYPSQCGRVTFLDTPGVNAEDAHDQATEMAIAEADAAILLVSSSQALGEPVLRLVKVLSGRCLPLVVGVNCWDDGAWHDGEPATMESVIPATIQSQLQVAGALIASFHLVNILWAAAARTCLARKNPSQLFRESRQRSPEILDSQSGVPALERFCLPHPLEAFHPEGLEARVLSAKFIKQLR